MQAIKTQYPDVNVVGEVFNPDPALSRSFLGGQTQYDGIDDLVDSVFDFPFTSNSAKRLDKGSRYRLSRKCSPTTISIPTLIVSSHS